MTVRVGRREELRRVRRAFTALPKDLKTALRKEQRAQLQPIWKSEIDAARSSGGVDDLQRQTFGVGTRVRPGLPIVLVAGASNKKHRGGATGSDLAKPMEFGTARRQGRTKYYRQQGTKRTTVTRHASRQLRPARRTGYVVHPALSQTIPRIVGLWVTTIYDRINQATEGK
ncbi:hypothetical protein ACFWGN_04260 [Oerskovia sp. NPDC060338]|uniref:hypothetical protein n=1 Tax=Oerskovia sp. NPDC060338 TaxID=3347100 RepID=UPI003649203A